MGQSAEKMAKLNHIPRDEQDQFALRSHRLAAAGTQDGRLTAEMMPYYVPPQYSDVALSDNGIRPASTLGALAALQPVVDRIYATVTPGNSSLRTVRVAGVVPLRVTLAEARKRRASATVM